MAVRAVRGLPRTGKDVVRDNQRPTNDLVARNLACRAWLRSALTYGAMADDSLLVNGSSDAPIPLVLAHGAGAAMDSRFMNVVAEAIGGAEVRVVRFEFPYMAARRISGKRGAPDREPVLVDSWRTVIAKLGDAAKIVIGGKSMGGRIASMVADEAGVAGLVCL